MTTFKALDRAIDECLRLPVQLPNGETKTYEIPDVDAKTGIWCQKMLSVGVAVHQGQQPEKLGQLDDDEERGLYERVLGPVYQEMIDDGIRWRTIKRVGMTAFLWAAGNEEVAERFWETGGDPKALGQTQNRRTRRSGSRKKANGGAGGTTPRATSTNGTKTPNPGASPGQ